MNQEELNKDSGFSSWADIYSKKESKKAPAYPWQDLALRVIAELGIPNFKRSSVFKICKDNPSELVERALNDTKELCTDGAKWRYFFKVVQNLTDKK